MESTDTIRAEESLRDFILDEYRIENARAQSRGGDIVDTSKYRRLTLEILNGAPPRILVQVASYSAIFNIETGKKVEGGMSNDDIRLVESWLSMNVNKNLLINIGGGKAQAEEIESSRN